MDVLVTGGAGFIGNHLTNELTKNNTVHVLDSLRTSTADNLPDAVEFHHEDVRDSTTLANLAEQVDVIFHQAALVSVDESIDHPQESHSINVEGTLSVLEAARKHDTRVVLASSAAIYGHPETIPISEEHPKEPTSPYGLDKLTADQYARLYHELYGLDTVALRYFNVYGPRQTGDYAGVISVFLEQALNDDPITVHGDGDQTRDFVHVDDIVQANLDAARTDNVGEAYNIGTGESHTIRELAELVQELTDTNSEIVHTDAREGDIDQSQANVSKASELIGYEPTVSFSEGLERTVDWFRH